ncbi:MAG TPA: glycoside hydrolase family 28 protein, partial [Candidatus Hydrogenedentes bacterium]|nr:glycoside hydrolase family 28 protein [Candidatus Hydrogenedentota bacterium]
MERSGILAQGCQCVNRQAPRCEPPSLIQPGETGHGNSLWQQSGEASMVRKNTFFRRRDIISTVLMLSVFWAGTAGALEFQHDARAYGARGDGEQLDTAAIQAAVDACHEQGGGQVTFGPGRYLAGTIVLKSGVSLYLSANAVLLGSPNLEDYPEIPGNFVSYTNNYTVRSLIVAEDASAVGIEGPGAVDGQGAAFEGEYLVRPYLIRFISCRDVRLDSVTLRDSAMWTLHLLDCEDVHISGIDIRARVNKNNDGIDIDCSENVRVSDCHVWTGDDAIVLKSTAHRPTKNVTITNCVLSSHCNALKMGTESNGGFQQIAISNCVIYDTHLAGIALETVDGGLMEGIVISNVTMKHVGCPLFIRLGNRARPPRKDMETPGMGTMRNISISNVEAAGAGIVGGSITGLPGHPVENVQLSNLRFRFSGGAPKRQRLYEVPEEPKAYPEFKMFGML